MRYRAGLSALILAALMIVAAPVFADHHESAKPSNEETTSPEAMQEYMAKYASPGPEHKFFEFFIGDWTNASTMYMGPEPMKSSGTAHWEWSLDGRYVQSTFIGEVMGQPFRGMAIDGYDRVGEKYFSIWFDTAGTGYLLAEGDVSDDGKVLTTSGETLDPMSGSEVTHRMVTTIKDQDHFSFTMYNAFPDADEVKWMEIEYTRAKESSAKK